jgi:hypothetical protein
VTLATASAMLWSLAGGQLLADDFESGMLLSPMTWGSQGNTPTAPLPLELLATAAHRGDGGLSFTQVPDGGTVGTAGSWLNYDFTPLLDGGMLSTRLWVRERQSNGAAALIFEQLYADTVTGTGIVLETGFNHTDGTWHVQGYDVSMAPQSVVLGTRYTYPDWHLVELELTGIGTPAGSRTLFVDGVQSAQANGLDLSTALLHSYRIGADYLYLQLGATVDIDDVRLDTATQADQLVVGTQVVPAVGQCAPAVVEMLDVHGTLARSPYAMTVDLSGTQGASFYAAMDCSGGPVAHLAFPAGAQNVSFGVRFAGPGLHRVQARNVDFLSPPSRVPVTFDAGTPPALGPDQTSPEAVPTVGDPPAIAFGSGQYLAVWKDPRALDAGLFAGRFDGDGGQLATSFPVVVHPGSVGFPDVAANGNDFVVVWNDQTMAPLESIYGARVSAAGAVQPLNGAPISAGAGSFRFVPQVRCATQSCLVTWSDRTIDPHWALNSRAVDATLNLLGSETPLLANMADHYLPRLALGGSGYLLAWSDATIGFEYGVGGIPLDTNGAVLAGGGVLTSNISASNARPAAAWDGTVWWVAWRNDRYPQPELELARVDVNGAQVSSPPGPDVGSNTPHDPVLTFDGVHVWLVYALDLSGAARIEGLRYGSDGFPIDVPQRLSGPAPTVSAPALAGDGSGRSLLLWEEGTPDGGGALHHRLLFDLAPDAGGVTSDGGMDAGTDGGTDGGLDAGPMWIDAGPVGPVYYRAGCGCDTSPGALGVAALLCLARRRLKWTRDRG